jgi:hypothetical protein
LTDRVQLVVFAYEHELVRPGMPPVWPDDGSIWPDRSSVQATVRRQLFGQ